MQLSDTDQYIKDSLENILSGKWNEHFAPDQINNLLELSFILNHLEISTGFVKFEYGDVVIKVSGTEHFDKTEYYFGIITSLIKKDSNFAIAISQFIKNTKD